MAKSRTKRTSTSAELDFAGHVMQSAGLEMDGTRIGSKPEPTPAAPIPTGGNPSVEGESIGGAIPNWEKNLVVEVYPGAVIERIDDMNWQAKILRRIDSTKATRFEVKNVAKWEGLGWYSSPGHAVRTVLQHLATTEPGRITLEQLGERIENLIRIMTPAVIAGERAKALDEAAGAMHDPRDAEFLRARARRMAAGTGVEVASVANKLIAEAMR